MEDRKVETKKKMHNIYKPIVWDTGSSLYDSFELKSFQDTLKSAIASRTLSMPHLSDRRRQTQPPPPAAKKSSKLFINPFQKLLRMLFRSRHRQHHEINNKTISSTDSRFKMQDEIYKSGGSDLSSLSSSSTRSSVFSQDQTSAAAGHFVGRNGFSPEMSSLVGRRRSVSERFTEPAPLDISCA
ncbi:uncharacterized protein LOC124928841 [Impatiens glandulifera]|uniref:uncharacterized protein LOC124928841 n=1 Tax=Impatiens glandulifera TaxID=253017 RepID=UPI001FB0DE1F|nr:uncharacterized protein LOC124928841 [Impatiens glandulifera]